MWKPNSWLMSFGFGPRFTLFGMPWKLDYAWQYNPYRGQISSRKWYLSIGFDFKGDMIDKINLKEKLKLNEYWSPRGLQK